jgi:streptogramin lyase/tRNA A-37 threonylcarbamoyl transferase component Bud32
MSSDPRIGTTVAGYRIESALGRGGMSVVYLAEHAGLKRKAALKLMVPELALDDRFRERFVRESQMAAALDHSNIIPIYEAGEVDGVLYIAMRYVRGTDLKSLLREGALPPQRAIAICSQVASALDAAHAEGLVHRDVKPANILLAPETRTDSPDHVYLSDFGITKRASSATGLTGTGQFIGTLDYAAPEQIEGRPLDGRTDVYSLGCVLYECLTGEVPFPRDAEMAVLWAHMSTPPPKVTEKQPELPEAIDDVVARGMAKSPGDRYETCGGLMTAASGALSPALRGRGVTPAVGGDSATPATIDQPVSTEPPTGPPRPAAPPEPARPPHHPPLSRRSLVPLAIIVAIALVLILVPLAFRNDGPSHSAGPTSPGVGAPIGLLVRIEPLTGKISSKMALGASLMRVAIGEGGVWVADSTSGTVTRVDPDTGRVAKVIPLAKGLAGIAVGLGSVWVGNANDGKVYRLDPDTNRVAQQIPVGAGIDSVVVGTGTVWVSNYRAGSVAQIDPSRGQVVATTRLDSVSDIATQSGKLWAVTHMTAGFSALNVDVYRIDPGARDAEFFTALINSSGGGGSSLPRMTITGGTAWVTAALDNTVIPVDLSKPLPLEKQTNKAIPTGRTPIAIVTDNAGFVWVANRGDQTVWKYSSDTAHAVAQISLPGTPTSIAAGGGAIWVTLFPGEATTG